MTQDKKNTLPPEDLVTPDDAYLEKNRIVGIRAENEEETYRRSRPAEPSESPDKKKFDKKGEIGQCICLRITKPVFYN